MKKFDITLSSINDVKEFVNAANRCSGEVDLISGRYIVDAKSIMGIFSLDLSKSITCQVHGDESPEVIAEIEKFVK